MHRSVLAIALAGLTTFASAGVEFAASDVRGLDYGLVCGPRDGVDVAAPETDSGTVRRFEGPASIVVTTDRIALEPGATFGVSVVVPPPGAPVVTMTVIHPPFRETGTEVERYTTTFEALTPQLNAFTFDLHREMVPGLWTFVAEADGAVIYRVSFTVTADGSGASPSEHCRSPDVISRAAGLFRGNG
ncbi:MAG: DUF3859 domain-containing protein [Pseudomonadota bacterium]